MWRVKTGLVLSNPIEDLFKLPKKCNADSDKKNKVLEQSALQFVVYGAA